MLKYPETLDETNGWLEELRLAIMQKAHSSTYDHRPFMPDRVKQMFPHMMEENQLLYARFKLAIAQILQPQNVLEIGTGWGVSARALIEGFPSMRFHGIDNGEMGVPPEEVLGDIMAVNPNVTAATVPTDYVPSFLTPEMPELNLIHIDGGHGREQKIRDIVKAFQARPRWILVDDVHDVMVAAGTFDGIWKAAPNPLKMLLFENSHTGNLLIYANQREAVDRP